MEMYLLHTSIRDLDSIFNLDKNWRRSFESETIVFGNIRIDNLFQVDRVVRISLGNLVLWKLVRNEC